MVLETNVLNIEHCCTGNICQDLGRTSYTLPFYPFLTIQRCSSLALSQRLLQLQHFPVPHVLPYLTEDMDDAIAGRDVTDNYACILDGQHLHKNQREKQKD